MAANRTNEQILDQVVYAVAAVCHHYGPGLSAEGLADVRRALSQFHFRCDSSWRVDVLEPGYYGDEVSPGFNLDEPNPGFYPRILNEYNTGLPFDEIVASSKTGVYPSGS